MDSVTLYTDGGCRGNPGPSAIAYRITDDLGEILGEHYELVGEGTNNTAEYLALIAGLKACQEFTEGHINHFSDSQLLVNQCNLEWKIKQPHIRELYLKVLSVSRKFQSVEHNWVNRDNAQIEAVDSLVSIAFNAK